MALVNGSNISGLRARATHALRPALEAVLLAAVALGCVQAGWSALTPRLADASGAAPGDDPDFAREAAAEVRSPFAPAGAASGSHAAAAMLAGVQLAGVRIAEDPAHNGAVLTLDGGAQRAFLVGQEISAGVRLAEVGATYVLFDFDGGQQQLNMSAAPGFSFARALMGEVAAPPVPALAQTLASASAGSVAAPAAAMALTPEASAWLGATLARVESGADGARGWRVADNAPAEAVAAGLRGGDLITAVNGVGPGDAAAVLRAVSQGAVQLTVQRGGDVVTLSLAGQSPT